MTLKHAIDIRTQSPARALLIIGLMLTTGCDKKEPGSLAKAWDGTNTVQAGCRYVPATYSGNLTSDNQTVAVGANVIDQPLDHLNASVCKPSGECKATPSIHIYFERNAVRFVNAVDAGFTTYAISEALCQ